MRRTVKHLSVRRVARKSQVIIHRLYLLRIDLLPSWHTKNSTMATQMDTDIEVAESPFSPEEREWLSRVLARRTPTDGDSTPSNDNPGTQIPTQDGGTAPVKQVHPRLGASSRGAILIAHAAIWRACVAIPPPPPQKKKKKKARSASGRLRPDPEQLYSQATGKQPPYLADLHPLYRDGQRPSRHPPGMQGWLAGALP